MRHRNPASALVSALLELLQLRGVFAWRVNTTGVWDARRGLYRTFTGLKGTADIQGVIPGRLFVPAITWGVACMVEAKYGTGRLSKEQVAFLDAVTEAGGFACCARDVGQLDAELTAFLNHSAQQEE